MIHICQVSKVSKDNNTRQRKYDILSLVYDRSTYEIMLK